MQTDRWITNIEPEYRDPSEVVAHDAPVPPVTRSAVWIDPVGQRNISASYIEQERRRIVPKRVANPLTPIPARASAHPERTVKVRPRYTRTQTIPDDSDVTRIPTMPNPTIWQYESPEYEAESSLSSLSLVLSEAGTPAIDEMDTVPPPRKQGKAAAQKSAAVMKRKETKSQSLSLFPRRQKSVTLPAPRNMDEIDTVPPGAVTVVAPQARSRQGLLSTTRRASNIVESNAPGKVDEAASWTAGKGKNSALAQRVAGRGRGNKRIAPANMNPIDSLRWWLLVPGRIEFLLWLSGTVVLVCVTCLLLFATALSSGWMSVGLARVSDIVSPSVAQTTSSTHGGKGATAGQAPCAAPNQAVPSNAQCHSTTVTSSGLQLTLSSSSLLLPGMSVYLHGQGFSDSGQVTFTHDAQLPCQPAAVQADAQGTFNIEMLLGVGFGPGTHEIVAYDTLSKRSITVSVTLSPAPMGKSATATPVPPPPGVTPTATAPGNGQGGPTPVGQTPVPVTPTPEPTKVPPTPTVAPSPTMSATPSPTPKTTPTVTPTTTKAKNMGSSALLGDSLYDKQEQLTSNPWLWVAVIGYGLSMAMLGIAGMLYHRKRRAS